MRRAALPAGAGRLPTQDRSVPNRRSWRGRSPRSTSAPCRSPGTRATPGSATSPATRASFSPTARSGINSEQSACPYDPANPAKQAPPGLPFTAQFSAKPSWYDPVSGTAGIYGQGDVRFSYASRGIDLTAGDPEVEIDGAASRAIFRFNGAKNTPIANRRVALVDLDLSGQPTISNGGKTFSYTLMRGALTADGVSVFAGFYQAGTNFGCVSVAFTTP